MSTVNKGNCPKDFTKVVFRKYPDGDILALFPEIAADNMGVLCSSYEHIGQHGGASYHLCISRTKPAKKIEYKELKKELEQRGYHFTVIKRTSQQYHDKRKINNL